MMLNLWRKQVNGVVRVARLVGLLPVLLALWSVQAQAVTVEGARAMQAAALCAAAAQGLPPHSDFAAEREAPRAVRSEGALVAELDTVLGWGQADLSKEAILRFAQAAAEREVSSTPAVLALSDAYLNMKGLASQASTGSEGASSLSAVGAIEESLAVDPRLAIVCAAPRPRQRAGAVAVAHVPLSLCWWHSLPLLPGLLALVVAVGGVVRNRPQRLLAQC